MSVSASSLSPGLVFIGDSITDCGRTYPTVSEFGQGYAAKCISALREAHPDWRFYNRGIAGQCIGQIYDRWQADCLDLQPSLVSFLAGVNDVDYSYRHENHSFDQPLLARQLEEMFASVRAAGARLVVLEPYAFDGELYKNAYAPRLTWLRQTTRGLAARYADLFLVPDLRPEDTLDGIHPTPDGHARLARQWLGETGERWGERGERWGDGFSEKSLSPDPSRKAL